jgi:hypothetical protein
MSGQTVRSCRSSATVDGVEVLIIVVYCRQSRIGLCVMYDTTRL